MPDDLKDYKAAVTKAVKGWKSKSTAPADNLLKLDDRIHALALRAAKLNADEKKELDGLKKEYKEHRGLIEKANLQLKADLGRIAPPANLNPKDLSKLADHTVDIMEKEAGDGLTIGKGKKEVTLNLSDLELTGGKITGISVSATWKF